MKTVQDVIDQAAMIRLNKEIEDYFDLIRNYKLYKGISGAEIKDEKGGGSMIWLHQFIYDLSSLGAKMIRERFLDEYILEGSQEFTRKVEALKQVDKSNDIPPIE